MATPAKRELKRAKDYRDQKLCAISNLKGERRVEEDELASIDTSGIEEAPESLLYGGEKERSINTRMFKMGLTCSPSLSKAQALQLCLSGWVRRPGCGATTYCHLGGKPVSWWGDIYYRRAGEKKVLVFAVVYAYTSDHARPSMKVAKTAASPPEEAQSALETSPEVVVPLLKEYLHPNARLEDVSDIELAFYLKSIIQHRDLDKLLYVVSKPSRELWALSDPKLFDPLGAYKDWEHRTVC